jgi:glycerophosphoryl diester phosphodiesterase
MAITLPTTLPRPLIHGHRGCRGLFPENTLPAFLHALVLGVDVLELDVVISADNQVVVSHEPWLAAHLGWSPAGLPIAPSHEYEHNMYRMSYAEIRQCQVGVLGQPIFPQQQQVPTYRPLLSEVLLAVEAACQQLGRGPVRYSIEIKSTPATDGIYHPAPAEYVFLVLNNCPLTTVDRITLLSFDPRVLKTARHLKKNARLCLLTEVPFTSTAVFDELGFVPNEFGPDYTLLTQQMVQDLRHYYPNLQLVCWTVNEQDDLIKIANWGIGGITTDYPNRAIDLFI